MNLNSVTELNLLNALRTLGALQQHSVPGTTDSTSTGTVPATESDKLQLNVAQLSRDELLRITQHLVEGLLKVQLRASTTAPSYLSVVFPCLFQLINNEYQDVRIAADEGLNKLIKFLRVSMTHQVICELFLELKRDQNPRSVSAALSKFALLTPRIRPSKRRFYTANLLPVLVTVCQREDEAVFEALMEHFPQIAAQLFYYASERELRVFLCQQTVRLSSETALIRRAIAQLLVLTCQHSRFPMVLLRLLLQHVLVELSNSYETSSHQRRAGLFNTLRYLSIAWDQVLITNPNGLLSEVPPSLRVGKAMSGGVAGTGGGSTPADHSHWAPRLVTKEAELTDLEQQLWSHAFFTCLDCATTAGAITVCTAALEALLQLLQSGRPARLYPRDWLTNNCSDWSTLSNTGSVPTLGTANPSLASSSSYEPSVVDDSEDSQAQFQSDRLRRLSRSSTGTELVGVESAKTVTAGEEDTDQTAQSLVRSLSSSSLTSFVDTESEVGAAQQAVRAQLAVVRARLAQSGEHHEPGRTATDGINGHDGADYPNAADVDYAWISSAGLPSESSDVVDLPAGAASEQEWTEPGRAVKLLTLRKLVNQLVAEDCDRPDEHTDESWPLAQCEWIVPYLVLHFCLLPTVPDLPRPDQLPRTSSQLLAVACLGQLTRLYPLAFVRALHLTRCCSPESHTSTGPTVVDLIMDLLEFHSDPQLRGQLCMLAGHVITSYLIVQSLTGMDSEADQWPAWSEVYPLLQRLLTGLDTVLSIETSGTTVRLAVAGLSSCANAILTSGPANLAVSKAGASGSTTLAHEFLHCLARHAVPLARHSYRLVRREFMVLVSELDWHAIVFLEQQRIQDWYGQSLVRPARLIDVAWLELWRLLSDPDGELRTLAASALLSLSTVLTAGGDTFSAPKHTRLLHRCLERRLHYWYPHIYSSARMPISSFGLTDCWTQYSFPPCLSDLPTELDVGPASVHYLHSHSPAAAARLMHAEALNSPQPPDFHGYQPAAGTLRLFRECVAALIELPCPSLLSDDRYMLHGVVRCLNRLFGQAHILAHSRVWFTEHNQPGSDHEPDAEASDPGVTEDSSSSKLLARQNRPRIALVSWQCLTLLSATSVTTTDLELHTELVSLTTGCVLRWAVHALTEGSIPTGTAAMSLDLQHAYTRFALSYLHHVARVLFILWHVVDDVQPAPAPAALLADPFHPDAPMSILNSISLMAQTGASAVAQATQAAASRAVQSAAAAASVSVVSSSSGGKRGLKLNASFRRQQTAQGTSAPSDSRPTPGNRRLLGYFSHLPHYMALYRTVKAAFQTFKISSDPHGSHDRFMSLLCAYLHALSRLMTNLRLAETAPYSDELLTYVTKLYHWQPGLCLDAASQILRAFVGTNLISHWDSQLARLYNLALGGTASVGETTQSDEELAPEPANCDAPRGMHDLLDRLLKRHAHRIDLLVSTEAEPVSAIANWSGALHHLSRAPITAWIRFARQWRVPLPLASRASAIKSELAEFFKRFEHIVIQSMEVYRWTTCSDLQSGILNLLTHLICLQLNYQQLDTGQHFLKTVMNHCQNLSLEVQRLHLLLGSLKHGPYGTRRGPGELSATVPPQQQQQRLVHAIFRFLVSLAHHQQPKSKPSAGSSTTVDGQTSTGPDDTNNSATEHGSPPMRQQLVEFNQVIHMAETLAAEGLDPGSVVLSSLVPIVADLYVIQRLPVPVAAVSQQSGSTNTGTLERDCEVQREAVLGFVLRRLTHLPASYDQLCLILEEAALVPNAIAHEVPGDGGSRLDRVLESVFGAVLAHLDAGTALLDSRADLDALLRLFDHLVLSLTARDSPNTGACHRMIDRLNQVMISAGQPPPCLSAINATSVGFRRWAVMQVACGRLILNLTRLWSQADTISPPSLMHASTDVNTACPGYVEQRLSDPDLLRFMEFPLRILSSILRAVHQQLIGSPHLATSLTLFSLDDSGPSASFGLLMQLLLIQLLTLIDLVESDRYRTMLLKLNVWRSNHDASIGSTCGTFSSPAVDMRVLTRLVSSIGQFEPLVPILWYRVAVRLDQSTAESQPNTMTVLSNCPVDWHQLNGEMVSHAFSVLHLSRALERNEKPIVIFNRLFGCPANEREQHESDQGLRVLKRVLDMWQVDEAPVREWFSRVAQCPATSRLFLDRFAQAVPHLSTLELRTVLHLLTAGLHPTTTGLQLALLWDHYIAPRNPHAGSTDVCASGASCCVNCHRNPLPLGLQHQAIRRACTLLRQLIKAAECNNNGNGFSSQSVIPVPLAVLMDYCARLPKRRTLPAINELGELLDQLISTIAPGESSSVRHASDAADVFLDVVSVMKQIDLGQSDWLLDAVRSLLTVRCSATSVRMAAQLMQLLVSLNLDRMNERIGHVLRNTCPRCCPRLIQYALAVQPGLACASPDRPDTQPASITPQMSTLFRMARDLLFERVQQIIHGPYRLIEQAADRTLYDAVHSQLTGLSIALIHYLDLVPHLPVTDAISIESESLALDFLCVSVEFALYTMGYPLDRSTRLKTGPDQSAVGSQSRLEAVRPTCPAPSFLHSLLDLMDRLLQNVSGRFLRGVDVLGERGAETLALFVTFLASIDRAASLSRPLTPWTTSLVPDGPVEDPAGSSQPPPPLNALLSPAWPSLFGSWHPDPIPASVIAGFTTLSASCMAATVLSGPTDLGLSKHIEPQGFVQPCQLLNRCRLLRSGFALASGSALARKINVCLVGCVRLLNTRPAGTVASDPAKNTVPDTRAQAMVVRTNEPNFNLRLDPDPEMLLAQVARLGGCGWLDRRQFEQMWMAYLELLAGSDEDDLTQEPLHGTPAELNGGDAELVERNQCIVLGLHGLTRLLLDVSLRPQPGNTIHSQLNHQPRLGTPHFSHTKLGRKLTALTSLIEQERLRLRLPQGGTCPTFAGAASASCSSLTATGTMVPSNAGSRSWFAPLLNSEVTDHAAELMTDMLFEVNLERFADAPDNLPGPSQFAVHWLVRRLMSPAQEETNGEPGTVEILADNKDGIRPSSSPVLTPRPRRVIPVVHSIADYEDLLFSCLQSIQLLYQSWARAASDSPKATDSGAVDVTRIVSGSGTTMDRGGANSTSTTSKTPNVAPSESVVGAPSSPAQPNGLVLASLQSVVRSAVILSDLFTSREQFVWLNRYLQDIVDKFPTPKQFPAPIHLWLTLGLARCVAVLELARSGPQSEPLHETTLEPAVRQTLAVLQTNVTVLQDVGLQAAMLLLHAALLIRAQPHQRQTQQHSPPTGSPSLNELYSKVCLYLEQKLVTLFSTPVSPAQSVRQTSDAGDGSVAMETGRQPRWIPAPPTESARSSAGSNTSVGFKRFMTGVFGGSVAAKGTASSGIEPSDVPASSAMPAASVSSAAAAAALSSSSVTLVSRVERHQLTVLAAAFFLAEHFSAPPIYPVLTDFGSGLTEMLSGLTSNLFRLAHPMLSDMGAVMTTTQPGSAAFVLSRYSTLGAGTTSDLCYSLAVHTAWCRGIERLVLMGRLGKGATESLQKLCVMRLRSCRSPHLSLPVLRLLVTCMYTNAGRLNTQLQHYRRLSPGTDSSSRPVEMPREHKAAVSGTSPADSVTTTTNTKAIGPSNETSVTYMRQSTEVADITDQSAVILPVSTLSSDATPALPPSLLMDSEATAGMTQEFLSCLWERLRGGVVPIVHAQGEPTWLTSAWTSAAEASVVARLLPATSTDIIQAIAGLLVHRSPQSPGQPGWDTVIKGHVEDPVLNKALGEFARLDHAHPDLAAQTLAQLFARFLDRPGGRDLIRQWVILSLPTLLSRQPRRLAIWATTVCLLAASTEPTLRAALCLCSTQVAFNVTNTTSSIRSSTVTAPTIATPDSENRNSDNSNVEQTSPLLSDLLCLAAVHFVRSGLLSRRDSHGATRREQRQTFLNTFQPQLGDDDRLGFPLGQQQQQSEGVLSPQQQQSSIRLDRDQQTLRRVYTLLQREMSGEM